jgi:hypothetical protein
MPRGKKSIDYYLQHKIKIFNTFNFFFFCFFLSFFTPNYKKIDYRCSSTVLYSVLIYCPLYFPIKSKLVSDRAAAIFFANNCRLLDCILLTADIFDGAWHLRRLYVPLV